MDKQEIRKSHLEQRNALDPNRISRAGANMKKFLVESSLYQNARTVMLYEDFRKEAPTEDMIVDVLFSGRSLVLPLTDRAFQIHAYQINKSGCGDTLCVTDILSKLRLSSMGILEPDPDQCELADLSSIDLVVVPGLAFDQKGNRIGYGKGCYDGFLPQLPPNTPKIGMAYDFQIVEELPATEGDIPMDYLLTESGLKPVIR